MHQYINQMQMPSIIVSTDAKHQQMPDAKHQCINASLFQCE